jgi:hypothetical protein
MSVEQSVEWQGKLKCSEKTNPVPFCPPQITLALTRTQTRTATVGIRRLTACAAAWPSTQKLQGEYSEPRLQ